jgi:uncharacterized protein YijF (DUF1287 family)
MIVNALTVGLVVLIALVGPALSQEAEFGARLSAAAIERTNHNVTYDAAYMRIAYPGGDISPDRGVCSDVVVRALRTLGVDLQKAVHEDMKAAFGAYPKHWGLSRPDSNIDHRRVPNLETYFVRNGSKISLSDDPAAYAPGDIVAWNLRGDTGWLPHIGIVTDRFAPSGRPMVVHNIGAGPKLEDVLFSWKMTGHYRLMGLEGSGP